jgi:hypothetical protein
LTPEGFRTCVLFIKLADRLYSPLTAASTEPASHSDADLPPEKQARLDRHYASVDKAIDDLCAFLGIVAA